MEFATGHRITRLTAQLVTTLKRRPSDDGLAPVGTEDGAMVLFDTDQGASGAATLLEDGLRFLRAELGVRGAVLT